MNDNKSQGFRWRGHRHVLSPVLNDGNPTGFLHCTADAKCIHSFGTTRHRLVHESERLLLDGALILEVDDE